MAPCELACPCRIPMPKVLRALRAGEAREARRLLEERCALPLSAALTCPAYCEKACRRKDLDHAVGMRALHLLAAETPEEPQRSRMKARPHRRIALTDASPAALGCAHRLHLLGHDVFVVRRLRCAEGIPREALDDDLGTLERTGIRFLNEETRLDPSAFDAVLDASDFPGHPEAHPVVRALAIGRDAADRVLLRLAGCSEVLLPQRACRAGKLSARELSALLPETQDERSEAWRCLHCDCRAADDCRLRSAADRLQAWRVPPPPRPAIEPDYSHPDLVHEPNKCIACGACLRIARLRQEPVGLSWHGRGADLRVAPPLGKTWKEALTHAAAECVKACPTASLAWKREAGPPCPVQAG